jgi:hypothetical protein
MKKIIIIWLVFLFGVFTFSPKTASAKVGVGVNVGKIQVDEKLKAGMIYKLPPITVINTGDEPAEYGVSVAYHQEQSEIRPRTEWFMFSPIKFKLEPGKGQLVETKINLPLTVAPGNYFAYLEGHPLVVTANGNTSVGVAAAAKLYFTVVPANIFYGVYYKVISFFKVYAPWPQRAAAAIAAIGLLILFKKFFNIKINLKKPADNE